MTEQRIAVNGGGETTLSTSRSMAQMLAVPSNRACADCRVTLMDASQVYVSFSPIPDDIIAQAQEHQPRYNHFLSNHLNFAPPGVTPSAPIPPDVSDPPVDPALLAAVRTGGHGVFVCAMCAAAHKLLGPEIAVVQAAQDYSQWTVARVVRHLQGRGGNARATAVYEKYVPLRMKRPRSKSSIAERLTFIRAKYEALAFVLPPCGPFGRRAWRAIVDLHPEWKGLWGADLSKMAELNCDSWGEHGNNANFSQSLRHLLVDRNATLPNRLVDHFCVVDYSPQLEPNFARNGAEHVLQINSPEDVCLAPVVTDCFPSRDAHADMEFPEHIGAFVCPEGYRPATMPQAPTFFTFVLTCADGNRLYGGALKVFDKSYGLDVLRKSYANSGCADKQPDWLKVGVGAPEESDVIYLPKCLVLLSHYPFFDLWRKVLQALYRIVLIRAPLPIERFIANFCSEVPLPPPGRVQVRFGFTANQVWAIERPPENTLPMASFSFRPLFASLSISNVMVVIACLLQETKVALLSRHYALLTPVAEGLISLLFPFRWQGLFIPIIPYSMLDVLDSPVPFLIGLHSRYLREVPVARRPRGVVYVDLDADVVHLGWDDETNFPRGIPSMPEKDASKLRSKLAMFAAAAYLVPDSNKGGKIFNGDDMFLHPTEREVYARFTPDLLQGRSRRKDYFRKVDKAYTDKELTQPMIGFLSEQGQYHGGEAAPASVEAPRLTRLRNLLRLKSRPSSMSSQSSIDDESSLEEDEAQESLLEINDPKGFFTEEVRKAFLRFFVTIMRDYRTYMGEQEFEADHFVSNMNLSPGHRSFVATLTQTQMFQRFVQERRESPNDPECLFFDYSINAKINRSKLTTLANLGRGGKRDTTFLDDKSKKVSDIYTPPPPSNLGLTGQTYHYGSFPELNPELFGKTRKPREWPTKSSTLRMLRSSAIPDRTQSVSFAAKTFGLRARSSAKPSSTKKIEGDSKLSRTNLEDAILLLSRPYAAPQEKDRQEQQASMVRQNTNFSAVTLPSTLEWSSKDVSSAEEIVLNARRRVSILLAIFINFQSLARGYIGRHPRIKKAIVETTIDRAEADNKEVEVRSQAMKTMNSMLLIFRARRMLLQSIGAAILLQANFRRRRAEIIFNLLKDAVTRVQACSRRWLVQRRLRQLLEERMKTYATQVFTLWKRAHTPLAYRTNFWRYLKTPSLLCNGIVETELQSLAKEVSIQSDENRLLNPEISRLIRNSDRLGLSVNVLRNCTVDDNTFGDEADRIRATSSFSSWSDGAIVEADFSQNAAARVNAERTQIYQKIANASTTQPEFAETLYQSFGMSLKEKRRKVLLANLVWSKFRQADESVKVMVLLFPELGHSSNIKFSPVSKKGVRRIRSSDSMPAPLKEARWSHTFVDRRIRKNLAEVASVAMLYLPRRYENSRTPIGVTSKEAWQRAVASAHGNSGWKDCRLNVMRAFVHNDREHGAKDSTVKRPTASTSSRPMFPDVLPSNHFPDLLQSEQ